jgi:hypothetical protein
MAMQEINPEGAIRTLQAAYRDLIALNAARSIAPCATSPE